MKREWPGEDDTPELIKCTWEGDHAGISRILEEDPTQINATRPFCGRNAPMYAATHGNPNTLNALLFFAEHLNFAHRDNFGATLLMLSQSGHPINSELICDAYDEHVGKSPLNPTDPSL